MNLELCPSTAEPCIQNRSAAPVYLHERFGQQLHISSDLVKDDNFYYPLGTDLTFKMLTAEEETALFTKAAAGDEAAREFLIRNHLLFAATYARRLVKGKLADNETVSAANLGLMKAFARFDYTKRTRFTAYAKFFIRSEVATLWKSKSIVDFHGNYPVKSEDYNDNTMEPMDEAAGVQENHEHEDEDTASFVAKALELAKGALNAKERELLDLHYNQGLSLREIADTLGVTRAATSAAHVKALGKLRTALKKAGVNNRGEVV